jgi:hypothetical protein
VTKVDVLRNQIDLDIVMASAEAEDASPLPVAVSEG